MSVNSQESRVTLRIVSVIAASLVTLALSSQSVAKRPTLVVGITVEGLNEDYLQLLSNHFGSDGFNRLREHGVTLADVSYGPGIDATAATAMIVSGAPASISGIPSATVFDTSLKQAVPVLLDKEIIGSFTSETLSPRSMMVSTVADELRVAEGGINYVYSIAPDAQQAIIMAGHAGNAAMWINDVNGNWSTSTFYKDVPASLTGVNFSSPLASRLDTIKWEPRLKPALYPDIPAYKKAYPFKHVFPRNDKNRFRAFKASAPVNTEVTSAATSLISAQSLGKRDVTDMLQLAYTVAPYPYSKDPDSRLEVLDSYLRLDADLARLFKAIEHGPGMDNTLIYVAGIPAPATGKRDDERFNIPYGQFSTRKALSLLNMYLMAIHGNGDWVAGYHNGQIFLNQALIKDRGVDLDTMRRETAEFLTRMAGVIDAYTISDVTARLTGSNADKLQRNTSVAHAGDVFITVAPGWEIVEEDTHNATPRVHVSRLAAASYPVIIMAPSLKSTRLSTEIDACTVAPTVTRLLRIRSPNGAQSQALWLER